MVWAGRHKAKSPYLAEIGRFWGLGRPPQSKIALSRRDRTILGFGQATTKQNRLYLAGIERFWGLGRPPLGEIRRFCFVAACPIPKIVLSRRDKAILLCGEIRRFCFVVQTPKSSYLGEIGTFSSVQTHMLPCRSFFASETFLLPT